MDGSHRQREYAEHARRTQAAQARAYAQAMQQQQMQGGGARRAGSLDARFDPQLAMASRAASGMAMTDGSVPMGAPPSARRVHFDPALEGTRAAVPRPVPPRVGMTDRVTGSGPQISPAEDPLERGGAEHLAGETPAPGAGGPYTAGIEVVSHALHVLLLCLLVASVFALPERARMLWLVVAVQATLATVAARLYEVARAGPDGAPAWADTAFRVVIGVHAFVSVAVVAVAAWRVYKTVRPGEDDEDDEDEGESRKSRRAKRERRRKPAAVSVSDALAPEFSPVAMGKRSKRERMG